MSQSEQFDPASQRPTFGLSGRRAAGPARQDTSETDLTRLLRRQNSALRRSVAKLTRENARLREQVEFDALTGVLNRRGLERFLKGAIAHCRRYRRARPELGVAVLVLDLDGLKAVNDRFGHAVGDATLVQVARDIRGMIRPDDAIGRLGGDEFVIVLWNIDGGSAQKKSDAFDHAIMEIAQRQQAEGLLLGASIGLVWLAPNDDPLSVIRRADEAMYLSKHRRRTDRERVRNVIDGSDASACDAL